MKTSFMAAFVAATLAFAHNAGAQDETVYGYIGVGISSNDASQSTDIFGDDNDEAQGVKLFVGGGDSYGDKSLGFELGLFNHGESNYGFGSGASADIEVASAYAAFVGAISVTDGVSLFGKLGSHYWKLAATGRGSLSGKDEGNGFDWFYGVGIDFGAADGEGAVLRLEYEVFSAEPEVTIDTLSGTTEVKGDYEASHISLSWLYRF